ncbi:MAG: WbuC family cupin fold metalloprotein [Akkermansiaceae bacterium]
MASIGTDWIAEQPDILRSTAECPALTPEIIGELKSRATASPRRRARWCAHADNSAETQEMVIVLAKDSCIPPHRHPGRSESLSVLEGRAKAWFFDDAGQVIRCLPMTPHGEGGVAFYRTNPAEFHTLEIESEFFIFIETTRGPFDPASTEIAPFAPREQTPQAYAGFFARLS